MGASVLRVYCGNASDSGRSNAPFQRTLDWVLPCNTEITEECAAESCRSTSLKVGKEGDNLDTLKRLARDIDVTPMGTQPAAGRVVLVMEPMLLFTLLMLVLVYILVLGVELDLVLVVEISREEDT